MNEGQTYAISQWHDTAAIYDRLHALIQVPPMNIRPDRMKEFLDYFDTKCTKSRALTDEAKNYIPGGVQHNLAFNYPFPIAVEKADGAFMWDADGNQYIDFLQAGGPTVL
ncbi:MAG TPA: aspartate aminotransferase family protein, partial [Clostridia bacterium]|nr:aspartate aminotransferase family protein [Clostridia bacterium]